MRETGWGPDVFPSLSPSEQAKLLWLLTAEKIAAKLPTPTGEYKDPDAVVTGIDLALFGAPMLPSLD